MIVRFSKMVRFGFLVGFVMMAPAFLCAAPPPAYASKRFEANVAGKTWLLLLEKRRNELSGFCHDPERDKVLALRGMMLDEAGRLELSEMRDKDQGGSPFSFTGVWTDHSLQGIVGVHAQHQTPPFTWREVNAEGSAEMEVITVAADSVREFNDRRIGKEIKCHYLQVLGDDSARKRISGELRLLAYNAGLVEKSGRIKIIPTIKDVEARIWQQLEETEVEWKDGYLDQFDYDQEVVWNNKNLLCVRESNYTYSGGAHGYHSYRFHVFSLVSGEKLTLNDLCKPGYQKPFVAWGRADLLRQAGCRPDQPLDEAGLDKDELVLNQNWWIDAKGLGFNYAPYEVACYARGMVEFQISWDQLQPWINPNAALSPFIKK